MSTPTIEQHVSVEEVAGALSVSERGELSPSRVGKQLRFPIGSVNAYLQRRRCRALGIGA